jgi:hypothetical protein
VAIRWRVHRTLPRCLEEGGSPPSGAADPLLIIALIKYVFFDYKPFARTSSQFLLLKERVLLFETWC